MADDWAPTPSDTAYRRLGGSHVVRAIVTRFFSLIEEQAPTLAALHRCDPPGHVTAESRERFTLFLIGWLGGPQETIAEHAPPSSGLRMQVGTAMGDAWLRCMSQALDCATIDSGVRRYLDKRFAEVADALREW